MKSPLHHIKHPEWFFEYFHQNVHHAFGVFGLAILGMLWGASNILTSTSASRQWWGFITPDFRDQNPTNENIKYALFGDGTPGSTAYTRLWDSSCVPSNVVYLSAWSGWPLAWDTIYVMNPWTYTITNTTVLSDCSAIIAKSDVYFKAANSSVTSLLAFSGKNHIILDNIKVDGQGFWTIWIDTDNNINTTLNNMSFYDTNLWLRSVNNSAFVWLYNSRFFNNQNGIYFDDTQATINNSLFFNNTNGALFNNAISTINNSQFFNNANGINANQSISAINNSTFFNNTVWIYNWTTTWIFNNLYFYNNTTWLIMQYSWYIDYYGTLRFFSNSDIYYIDTGSTLQAWSAPISSRSAGQIDTWSVSMNYNQITNPQNSIGQWLLNGTNRTAIRWIQTFDSTKQPIRYIFWSTIIQQTMPIWYHWSTFEEYGTNWYDYSSTKYIAEPESTLSASQQSLVNKYFWSWSLYTQNRQSNWCSLSAFHIKTLSGGIFNSPYTFEDHTIYILTSDEYRSNVGGSSNGFVFNWNCIALVGTGNTRFTKSGWGGMNSILYANDKHNIIIDTIKIDGLYYDINQTSTTAKSNIKLDGASNNSTLTNIQSYNSSQYGIYLGLSSHHNTITNAQVFNNWIAGIHLYYSSNYNVINNSQTYNNSWYGIWFANWSSRNAINNFQSYNNTFWVFWDLTTQENVINRAAIYNNSDAGIYFKNSSGNMLNDVRVYHNTLGIRSLYSSQWNKYYWELSLFDNVWGNFEWTVGNDTYLSPGAAWLFAYAWLLSTWTNIFSCLYATNPMLSWSSLTLLNSTCTNIWYIATFLTPDTTYVNYLFGLNMYKQKVPVRYITWNALIQLSSQYDTNKYIAETAAIRDTTPEWMTFVSSGSVQLNSWYTTNIYTAGIINIAVPVTLSLTPSTTSGYLVISWVATLLSWMINNGNTLQIYVLSHTWYNQTVTWTVTLWSVTSQFTITTRWLNQIPNTGSFAFANLTSIPLNTFTWSTVTVGGIETGVMASITFTPTTTSGYLEIYSWSTLISSGTSGLIVYSWYKIHAMAQSSSWYAQTITWYVSIGQWTGLFTIMTKWSDTVAPTSPTLLYPLSGEKTFFTTFEWTASTDTGSWIEWYSYQIANDSGFVRIINTGFITTITGTIGSPNSDFDTTTNKYYVRIKAQDRDGNSSIRSNIWYFQVIDINDRNFTNKTRANLRTYYDSNEITIEWIATWLSIWATVDGDGILYKNWSDAWTGTFVTNNDVLYITLRSSNTYDDTVSSLLTLANRTLEFNITTKVESAIDCTLSSSDQSTIQTIFDSLIQNYSGSADKYSEFLYTMQSMLADEIDFTNDCNLKYLEDLINAELGISLTGSINTWTHIAPNCKEYAINYDFTKQGYTSPAFKIITYFANRDSLARYIDFQNPGDCHINTYGASSWVFTNTDPSRHVASNGKIYTVQYGGQWYTANEFVIKKYFTTLSALRNYIDSKNTPQAVRSHGVDTSFTPQTYTAPNYKVYTIYKTDRWYMSYKLIKVRYFSTLSEIQYFINKNNSK